MYATLATVIFTIAALIFFALAARSNRAVGPTRNWAAASATILNTTIEANTGTTVDGDVSTTYYPKVLYEYQVNGQAYRSDKRVLGSEVGKGLKSWAERDIAAYQRGTTVPVYYNPANPAEAVLERTAPNTLFFNALALLFLIMALFFCAFNFGLADLLTGAFGEP